MKLGIGVTYKMLLSKDEFYENYDSSGHVLSSVNCRGLWLCVQSFCALVWYWDCVHVIPMCRV